MERTGNTHAHVYMFSSFRENCRCSQCVNQQTMQRNFNVLENTHVTTLSFFSSPSGLEVIWDEGQGKEHASFYDWDFLERYISPEGRRKRAPANYRFAFPWTTDNQPLTC